jgi:hypothetical protein
MDDGYTYLLKHVYRRQPIADEISKPVADTVRTIANTVADNADDILNQPAYNKDGKRRVGYVRASISRGSVQRAAAAAPGLGALAVLVMDNFRDTNFVKLFMYNSSEGLFPFHSDVLPANGERKIRVSISLSDMMPPFCLRRKKQGAQSEVCSVCRQFLTIIAMDFESSGRLHRNWEHGTLQCVDEHAVFVVFDVPCRSWSCFDIMVTNFFSALNAFCMPWIPNAEEQEGGGGGGYFPATGCLLALSGRGQQSEAAMQRIVR